ncbi:hypothetical protein [Antarctobacter jejuensis]|uniref:hypothetical protein n=1 Tax=Antarctobacter jejuensis TaxID=1439938 RepID=UPI003FCF7C58
MRRLFALGIACCLVISTSAASADSSAPSVLWQAQGSDINDWLKGGPGGTQTERRLPQPAPPADATGILRDGPRALPWPREAAVPSPLPATVPVRAFSAEALAGTWSGKGPGCTEQRFAFVHSGDGFTGEAVKVDPVDGFRTFTRISAKTGRAIIGKTLPDDATAYLSFARIYPAQVTRLDQDGQVVDLIKDWPATIVVARDAGSDALILRFVEPVSDCSYSRLSE